MNLAMAKMTDAANTIDSGSNRESQLPVLLNLSTLIKDEFNAIKKAAAAINPATTGLSTANTLTT